MGWCSGTDIFDRITKMIVEDRTIDKKELLVTLIDALEEQDWDCQSDSEYFFHPFVRNVFIELDPELEEYYEDYDRELEENSEEKQKAALLKDVVEREELRRLADKYGAQLLFNEVKRK